jgi:hypothetical protein
MAPLVTTIRGPRRIPSDISCTDGKSTGCE